MSNQRKPDMSYYMPLSAGCCPQDGPSKSIFSVPKFNYSPETKDLVKNLMKESRLTFTQKNGFQGILRNGNALPSRPSDVLRQQLYKHRHAERARSMGLPVLSPNHHFRFPNTRAPQFMRGCPTGGRRSFDSIKSSGVLEPPQFQIRHYIPCDKEKEKIRLAHRMAYGTDPPPPKNKNTDGSFGPKVQGLLRKESDPPRSNSSFLDERFNELVQEIQERIDFLNSMKALGNERTYHSDIVSQVQELLTQMKSISQEKTKDFVKALELKKLDKCFIRGGYKIDNILAL